MPPGPYNVHRVLGSLQLILAQYKVVLPPRITTEGLAIRARIGLGTGAVRTVVEADVVVAGAIGLETH